MGLPKRSLPNKTTVKNKSDTGAKDKGSKKNAKKSKVEYDYVYQLPEHIGADLLKSSVCRLCGRIVGSGNGVRYHFESHTRLFICTWPSCKNPTYSTSANARRHYKMAHSEDTVRDERDPVLLVTDQESQSNDGSDLESIKKYTIEITSDKTQEDVMIKMKDLLGNGAEFAKLKQLGKPEPERPLGRRKKQPNESVTVEPLVSTSEVQSHVEDFEAISNEPETSSVVLSVLPAAHAQPVSEVGPTLAATSAPSVPEDETLCVVGTRGSSSQEPGHSRKRCRMDEVTVQPQPVTEMGNNFVVMEAILPVELETLKKELQAWRTKASNLSLQVLQLQMEAKLLDSRLSLSEGEELKKGLDRWRTKATELSLQVLQLEMDLKSSECKLLSEREELNKEMKVWQTKAAGHAERLRQLEASDSRLLSEKDELVKELDVWKEKATQQTLRVGELETELKMWQTKATEHDQRVQELQVEANAAESRFLMEQEALKKELELSQNKTTDLAQQVEELQVEAKAAESRFSLEKDALKNELELSQSKITDQARQVEELQYEAKAAESKFSLEKDALKKQLESFRSKASDQTKQIRQLVKELKSSESTSSQENDALKKELEKFQSNASDQTEAMKKELVVSQTKASQLGLQVGELEMELKSTEKIFSLEKNALKNEVRIWQDTAAEQTQRIGELEKELKASASRFSLEKDELRRELEVCQEKVTGQAQRIGELEMDLELSQNKASLLDQRVKDMEMDQKTFESSSTVEKNAFGEEVQVWKDKAAEHDQRVKELQVYVKALESRYATEKRALHEEVTIWKDKATDQAQQIQKLEMDLKTSESRLSLELENRRTKVSGKASESRLSVSEGEELKRELQIWQTNAANLSDELQVWQNKATDQAKKIQNLEMEMTSSEFTSSLEKDTLKNELKSLQTQIYEKTLQIQQLQASKCTTSQPELTESPRNELVISSAEGQAVRDILTKLSEVGAKSLLSEVENLKKELKTYNERLNAERLRVADLEDRLKKERTKTLLNNMDDILARIKENLSDSEHGNELCTRLSRLLNETTLEYLQQNLKYYSEKTWQQTVEIAKLEEDNANLKDLDQWQAMAFDLMTENNKLKDKVAQMTRSVGQGRSDDVPTRSLTSRTQDSIQQETLENDVERYRSWVVNGADAAALKDKTVSLKLTKPLDQFKLGAIAYFLMFKRCALFEMSNQPIPPDYQRITATFIQQHVRLGREKSPIRFPSGNNTCQTASSTLQITPFAANLFNIGQKVVCTKDMNLKRCPLILDGPNISHACGDALIRDMADLLGRGENLGSLIHQIHLTVSKKLHDIIKLWNQSKSDIVEERRNLFMEICRQKNLQIKLAYGIKLAIEFYQRQDPDREIIVVLPFRYSSKSHTLFDDYVNFHELHTRYPVLFFFSHSALSLEGSHFICDYDDFVDILLAYHKGGIVVSNDKYRDIKKYFANLSTLAEVAERTEPFYFFNVNTYQPTPMSRGKDAYGINSVLEDFRVQPIE